MHRKHIAVSLLLIIVVFVFVGCGGGGGTSGSATSSQGGGIASSTSDSSSSGAPIVVASAPSPSPTPSSTPSTHAFPSPSNNAAASPTGSPTSPPSPQGAVSGPFAGASFFVDSDSDAAQQVAAWQTGAPSDAAEIQKIAVEPVAYWISGGAGSIQQSDEQWLQARFAAGYTPFIVLYSIPDRDNGGLAAGGQTSSAAYQSWISSIATVIGSNRAIVVLEPDALAQLPDLSPSDRLTRYALFQYAVSTLKALPNLTLYLDAGNPLWVPTSSMAPILQQAGVAQADGFSLNVSNFAYTSDCLTYGDSLSALVGGKHYVVDTSRNGLGPTSDDEWCNPPGRALGPQPLSPSGDTLCDALFWIKQPGDSDGPCNGGPSYGWWAAYALGLAQRAAY